MKSFPFTLVVHTLRRLLSSVNSNIHIHWFDIVLHLYATLHTILTIKENIRSVIYTFTILVCLHVLIVRRILIILDIIR